MDYFESTALPFVLQWEGGDVCDPDDSGGHTNKGITQRTYDRYRTGHGMGTQNVSDIADAEVTAIYRDGYWNVLPLGDFPDLLALVAFDGAVQHGPGRSLSFFQKRLSVTADGVWGPISSSALKAAIKDKPLTEIAGEVLRERKEFYDRIVSGDQGQSKFYRGWINRLNALYNFIARVELAAPF